MGWWGWEGVRWSVMKGPVSFHQTFKFLLSIEGESSSKKALDNLSIEEISRRWGVTIVLRGAETEESQGESTGKNDLSESQWWGWIVLVIYNLVVSCLIELHPYFPMQARGLSSCLDSGGCKDVSWKVVTFFPYWYFPSSLLWRPPWAGLNLCVPKLGPFKSLISWAVFGEVSEILTAGSLTWSLLQMKWVNRLRISILEISVQNS